MTDSIKKPRPPQRPSRAGVCRAAKILGFTLQEDGITYLIDQAQRQTDPVRWLADRAPHPANIGEARRALREMTPTAIVKEDHAPLPEPAPSPQPPAPAAGRVTIELPLGEPRGEYLSRLVDFKLTTEHARAAARLLAGLKATNTELKTGRRVEALADTFRWLLEQIE